MTNKPKISIFGVGKLSLGLIAAAPQSDEVDIHLCNRRGGGSEAILEAIAIHGGYELQVRDEGASWVKVADVHFSDDEESIKDLLQSDELVAILTSVKEGQPEVIDLLERCLSRRPGDTADEGMQTLLIPCENRIHPRWRTLAQSDQHCRELVLCRTMVDRSCSQAPTIGPDGRVCMRTESFSEWKIENPSGISGSLIDQSTAGMLGALLGAEFDGDIEPAQERKLYLMNGVQACVAVMAMQTDIDSIQSYVTDHLDGGLNLAGISAEFAGILAAKYPQTPETEIEHWRSLYMQRIRDDPEESAGRIMSRLSIDKIDDLFEDWRYKVASPLRQARDKGYPTHYLLDALAALLDLLRKLVDEEKEKDDD